MGVKYNRKFFTCTICDRKHYAKGLCRKHWTNKQEGRILEPPNCLWSGCKTKVTKNLEYQLCSSHYRYFYTRYINPKQTRDGGKWGYKERALYIRRKKNYCQWCGKKNRFLVIHHLDHNKRNSELKNLVTICQSCHLKHHKPNKRKDNSCISKSNSVYLG